MEHNKTNISRVGVWQIAMSVHLSILYDIELLKLLLPDITVLFDWA